MVSREPVRELNGCTVRRQAAAMNYHELLLKVEPFDRQRTLFVDDNDEVLRSARDYGIRWLLRVLKPDTRAAAREAGGFQAIHDFSEILPEHGG